MEEKEGRRKNEEEERMRRKKEEEGEERKRNKKCSVKEKRYIVDMRTEHFDPDFVLSGPNDPIRNRLSYLIPEQFVYLITPKPAFNGNNF